MSKFKYPVDTDQFQIIREQGLLYVDKTDLMFDLANRYRYVFLARPRRFGKSLLCNTFKAYFQGQKELFNGLKVMELEKEWTKFPVLHFDMSELKNCTNIQSMRNILSDMIARYEEQFGAVKMIEEEGARFRRLLEHIYSSMGKQVVVLIDEYDAPMMRYLYDEKMRESVRSLLRGFYQIIKSGAAYLRFVFITGVTKFSQLSIFSELNNLYQISLLDGYSGICGITQNELNTVLRPCVEEFAEALGISTSKAYALLKKNYDGYHFSPKGQDVYAPFSLLRALNDKTTNHYWFESGTSTALLEHLKRYPITRALDYDGVEVCENEFSIPCESADTPMPLLYQSGYLTIKSYNRLAKLYKLAFPNEEVRKGFSNSLFRYYAPDGMGDRDAIYMAWAKNFILSAEDNMEAFLPHLQTFYKKFPYTLINNNERHYQAVLYTILLILGCDVTPEVPTSDGRIDMVLKTKRSIYVMELKYKKDAEAAMEQIDCKDYLAAFVDDSRKKYKVGINFSEDRRSIDDWKVEALA